MKGAGLRLVAFLSLLVVAAAGTTRALLTGDYVHLVLFVPLTVWSIVRTVRLYRRRGRRIGFMLDAIAAGDYAFRFPENRGSADERELNRGLNRVRDILFEERRLMLQKERYYELILDSVGTGILVLDEAGGVYQKNEAAADLLGLSILTHVNQLARADEHLPAAFNAIRAGERRQVAFTGERGPTTLSVRASEVEVRGRRLRILALSEIGGELDEREIESWIKLIRVLTHEIMNSISPITSLSETLLESVPEGADELRGGLELIRTTGRGLLGFVESYRKFTRIPPPVPRLFDLRPFLDRLARLTRQEHPGIEIAVAVDPEDLILYADEQLTGQVVLNLLKNAVAATAGTASPHVELAASCSGGEQVRIEVTDNGPGIPAEVLPQIFVPFFTTKADGSGIGLSLSRQIMRLQDGSLTASSVPGRTRFVVTFR